MSRATRVYYGSSQQLETIGSLWHAGIYSVRLEVPRAAAGVSRDTSGPIGSCRDAAAYTQQMNWLLE